MIQKYIAAAALPEPASADTIDLALCYLRRGWIPVPVPHRQKGPTLKDWQNIQVTEANIGDLFNQTGNVGVLLGARSGGLTDVDLDCDEALALADEFLPETAAIFGRRSKPRSHRLYTTRLHESETKATIRYVEPAALAHKPAKPATLVELRIGAGDKGAQTVFPGSTHPSGEPVEWAIEGEPASEIDENLLRSVGALGAAALMVRHYPAQGKRHEAALVLGGMLARIPGMEASDIKRFATAIARAAGDDEAAERGDSAAGAVALLASGEPTPGLPRMGEVWGVELAKTVANWLGVRQEVDGDVIDTLARLDLLSYERRRELEAKKLGLTRVSVLDKLVAAHRQRRELSEDTAGFLSPVDPWPEPVDGAGLLGDLAEVYDRHIVLSKGTSTALALWTLHAHAYDAAAHSPILDIASPTPRCGKTNLLATIKLLAPKSLSAANVTTATIFRAIDRWHPTILIDEVDTFLADKSELRGILNSGHTRSQAFVVRCVGDDFIPKQFSTWCPKVLAHIGRVHPTLEDRSVRIYLRRKLKTEKVERIPKGDNVYSDIRRKCARWAADHLESLKSANPVLPDDINDRAADNWEPLLAIAEVCGSDWAAEAREVAVALSGVDEDETDAVVLLRDLKTLFERERNENPSATAMASTAIAAELGEIEDRKWPEYKSGKPITPANLAALLKLFKIKPRKVTVRGQDRQIQGYRFEQFTWTFKRYVGDPE